MIDIGKMILQKVLYSRGSPKAFLLFSFDTLIFVNIATHSRFTHNVENISLVLAQLSETTCSLVCQTDPTSQLQVVTQPATWGGFQLQGNVLLTLYRELSQSSLFILKEHLVLLSCPLTVDNFYTFKCNML